MMDLGGAEFSDLVIPSAADARLGVARHRGKRALDVALAILLLVFISPLMIVVALLILIDSRGPAFFVQRRTGFAGDTINVLKFRTMTVLENGEEVRHAGRNDDRVTRIGRFLRRSSIDELPQLVNVIKGEMSLVGPRPHALAHDAYYGALLPQYARRFRARPGITGLAQVSGLRGEILSLEYMERRVALDNAYIERWSMLLDLQILARTAAVAAFQSGAY
jgi:putative colanic acid biosynthesis UDP-glucose lipid carrier transferase